MLGSIYGLRFRLALMVRPLLHRSKLLSADGTAVILPTFNLMAIRNNLHLNH
jgi:hypothetical protein